MPPCVLFDPACVVHGMQIVQSAGDVLARGQSLVQAARVRQYTQTLSNLERLQHALSSPSTQNASTIGFEQRYTACAVWWFLPAPLGPSRPVISPSRARETDLLDGDLVAKRFVQLLPLRSWRCAVEVHEGWCVAECFEAVSI